MNEILLDLDDESSSVIKVKENDNRQIKLVIYKSGVPYDLTGHSIQLNGSNKLGGGIVQTNGIAISKNTATITMSQDFTRVPGEVYMDATILKTGQQLTTFTFKMMVKKSVLTGANMKPELVIDVLEVLTGLIDESKRIFDAGGAVTKSYFDAQLDNIVQEELPKKANSNEVRRNNVQIIMSDLGQDVKNAMTGGSVAIVGNNVVANENIVQKSIKHNKVDFLEVDENLFNKETVLYGYYVDTVGNLYQSSSFNCSDYIEIEGGQSYRYDSDKTHCYYDGNYVAISGNSNINDTAPSNAKYVRLTVRATDDLNLFRVYKQPISEITQRAYRPFNLKNKYKKETLDLVEIKAIGKNIVDTRYELLDKLISKNNVLVVGVGWNTSDMLSCEPSTTYTTSKVRFLLELDQYGLPLIGGFYDIASGTTKTFTTLSRTKFIIVSYRNTEKNLVQVEKGSVATSYEAIKYGVFNGGNQIIFEGGSNMLKEDLLKVDGYKKVADNKECEVYTLQSGTNKLYAIYQNIAVKYNTSSGYITLSQNGVNGDYSMSANFLNFPNLISGSYVSNIFILPWTRNRKSNNVVTGTEWRMIVITTKGQIYHNFPSRSITGDGAYVSGDEMKFEESVVWDLEERKFPTKSISPSAKEYCFPYLPNECYEHHPPLNQVSSYGNNGFDLTKTINGKTYVRFYRPFFATANNSFGIFNGFDKCDGIALIGTYTLNQTSGTRTCIFASDDGGREWYCKYEFSDSVAGGVINYGNTLDFSTITSNYTSGAYKMFKKSNVIPTDEIKEPTDKFRLSTELTITSITKAINPVVTTNTSHNLNSGDVVFIKQISSCGDFDNITNNGVTVTSYGNGIFFKVEKLTDTTVKLYEYIHAWGNNIPCQHVHGINRLKDGFTICTGETYPTGWIYYVPFHPADNYGVNYADSNMDFIRLTSSPNAIQRAIGVLLPDDGTDDIIFASDTSTTSRGTLQLPNGRTSTIARNSCGVFRGKLTDCDDFSKFVTILETDEPAYFYKEINDLFVFCGQRGEVAISRDNKIWSKIQLTGSNNFNLRGFNNDVIMIGDIIIAIKK